MNFCAVMALLRWANMDGRSGAFKAFSSGFQPFQHGFQGPKLIGEINSQPFFGTAKIRACWIFRTFPGTASCPIGVMAHVFFRLLFYSDYTTFSSPPGPKNRSSAVLPCLPQLHILPQAPSSCSPTLLWLLRLYTRIYTSLSGRSLCLLMELLLLYYALCMILSLVLQCSIASHLQRDCWRGGQQIMCARARRAGYYRRLRGWGNMHLT